MARLAERLDRRFEARAFLTIAVANDSDRADFRRDLDRLDRLARASAGPGGTLADSITT